jgi:hypothetical protein
MKSEDDAYAEFVADIILSYFAAQLQSGRSVIYESEIWELLGNPFPEDRTNQRFVLKEYVGDPLVEVENDNVIDFTKYRKKLN